MVKPPTAPPTPTPLPSHAPGWFRVIRPGTNFLPSTPLHVLRGICEISKIWLLFANSEEIIQLQEHCPMHLFGLRLRLLLHFIVAFSKINK